MAPVTILCCSFQHWLQGFVQDSFWNMCRFHLPYYFYLNTCFLMAVMISLPTHSSSFKDGNKRDFLVFWAQGAGMTLQFLSDNKWIVEVAQHISQAILPETSIISKGMKKREIKETGKCAAWASQAELKLPWNYRFLLHSTVFRVPERWSKPLLLERLDSYLSCLSHDFKMKYL